MNAIAKCMSSILLQFVDVWMLNLYRLIKNCEKGNHLSQSSLKMFCDRVNLGMIKKLKPFPRPLTFYKY